MPVSVAVTDPFAALRRGLADALTASGFSPEHPDDTMAWASAGAERAVILSLIEPSDLKCLQGLRAVLPELPVVTLLADSDLATYRIALSGGATGAIERASEPEEIVAALSAALARKSLLPASIAHSLAMLAAVPPDSAILDPVEIEWMRTLSRGGTVAQLAADVGYSEREMFRILADLYHRMGASNRLEAILQASRWGLLQEHVQARRSDADQANRPASEANLVPLATVQ